MCSYGIKGWKSGSAALKTFGHGCSFIREDEEEDQPNKTVECDATVAAPSECGETHTDMVDVVSGMHGGPQDQMQRSTSQMPNGKGLFAKDKRRLREKRRSTGIAKLVTEQHEDGDEETLKNTSYNEDAAGRHVVPTEVESSTEGGHAAAADEVASAAETDARADHESSVTGGDAMARADRADEDRHHENCGTKHGSLTTAASHHEINTDGTSTSPHHQLNSRSGYLVKSTLNHTTEEHVQEHSEKRPSSCIKSSKPILPLKPVKSGFLEKSTNDQNSFPAVGQNGRHGYCSNCSKKTEEQIKYRARIQELETRLEQETRKNFELLEVIAVKDSRIEDLETEIKALNEDLNLADEDYLRLEQENKALVRGISQIDLSNDPIVV